MVGGYVFSSFGYIFLVDAPVIMNIDNPEHQLPKLQVITQRLW